MNYLSHRRLLLVLGASIATWSCRLYNSAPDDPTDFDAAAIAGYYPVHQVEGHSIPWFHQLNTVNCQIAFVAGGLEVAEDAGFFLRLDYDYRCPDNDPPDGSNWFSVNGLVRTFQDGVYRLGGSGPNLLVPERGFDTWYLEVRPSGEFVSLRFAQQYRDFFADPDLTMGPRAAAPPPSSLVRLRAF